MCARGGAGGGAEAPLGVRRASAGRAALSLQTRSLKNRWGLRLGAAEEPTAVARADGAAGSNAPPSGGAEDPRSAETRESETTPFLSLAWQRMHLLLLGR